MFKKYNPNQCSQCKKVTAIETESFPIKVESLVCQTCVDESNKALLKRLQERLEGEKKRTIYGKDLYEIAYYHESKGINQGISNCLQILKEELGDV